jgi:hypothetical protein
MVALYRAGRQAEALEAMREGRQMLVDELGLEPGPELRRLERMILAAWWWRPRAATTRAAVSPSDCARSSRRASNDLGQTASPSTTFIGSTRSTTRGDAKRRQGLPRRGSHPARRSLRGERGTDRARTHSGPDRGGAERVQPVDVVELLSSTPPGSRHRRTGAYPIPRSREICRVGTRRSCRSQQRLQDRGAAETPMLGAVVLLEVRGRLDDVTF